MTRSAAMPVNEVPADSMYKVALVLDDTLDSTDGVQQYVLNVGKWLTAQGHEVHYLVGETKRTDIPNVHVLARNVKAGFNQNRMSIPLPASGRKIREIMERERFDVIHVQMPYSPLLAGKIIMAARPFTAVVGTFHVAPYARWIYEASRLFRMILTRSLWRFDAVMSVSETAQSYAKNIFKIDSTVVPNAIDLTPFNGAKAIKRYAAGLNIMFFGRLVERKGCMQFLKAVYRLHYDKAIPKNCRVLVCGKGHMEAQLKEFVSLHDLTDLVTFVGFVSEDEKANYLACGDVIVYPSTGGESFGIVLLEGMAAGRGVVIGGDNPGYRGVMHERPEALFNPNDEEAFADKIGQYLTDAAARKQATVWQRSFVQRFDIPYVGQQIVAVYDEALHQRKGS